MLDAKRKKRETVNYLTLLTCFACFGVLLLHSTNYYKNAGQLNTSWYVAGILHNLFLWVIPVFFMITGANLLGYRKRYSTKEFFVKRMPVFIQFVIWTVVYLIIYVCMGKLRKYGVIEALNKLLAGQINPHFWYFIPLFSVYLLMPLVSLLIEHKKLFKLILVFSVIAATILPSIRELFGIVIPFPNIGNGYMSYVLIGYYLKNNEIKSKHRIILYTLGILCTILQLAYSYHKRLMDGKYSAPTIGNYFPLTIFIISIAVFVFVKYSYQKELVVKILSKKHLKNFLLQLANCSLGIYFVQHLVQLFLPYNFIKGWAGWSLIAAPFVLLACTWIIVKIISYIPYLGNWLVGYQSLIPSRLRNVHHEKNREIRYAYFNY